MTDPARLRKVCAHLSPEERGELDALLSASVWTPLAGPQTMASLSPADIVGFGGAAGGGKTDLACGLALTQHRRSIIFRSVGTELLAIRSRLGEIGGARGSMSLRDYVYSYRGKDGVLRTVELGSFPGPEDHLKYQGRPHDLLVFDEASNMRERQVRFLFGWLRTTTPGQRKRALLTFNPPTTPEGRWIMAFFGPWLDAKHPRPAVPGELRYFATIGGADVEVPSPRPFVLAGEGVRVYDFDPANYAPDEIITPMSRTFIPSRVADNPFLVETGYIRVLQGLPEPLRSLMLKGDFLAATVDSVFQVIPTADVEAAVARWAPLPSPPPPMDSVGVDVAMRGSDDHAIATRRGTWFGELRYDPGAVVLDGPMSAALCVQHVRDGAPIHVDLFGVGAKTYGALAALGAHVLGVNVGEPTDETDSTGMLRYYDVRTALWWRLREALDAASGRSLALPPDRRLIAELSSVCWRTRGPKIKVESREDIISRIGRSPDAATAVVLAFLDTPKRRRIDYVPDLPEVPRRTPGIESPFGPVHGFNPYG